MRESSYVVRVGYSDWRIREERTILSFRGGE